MKNASSINSRCAILLIVCGAACSIVRGNDIYIAQTVAGAGDGSNCTNAYALTFFNTVANWSTSPSGSMIGPGTTVHLCGTFNAPAGTSGLLTFQGSGTSGNPITVVAEPGVLMQAPYWGVGGAIAANGVTWVTMNGQNNATIQATANGTKLANQAPNCGATFCSSGISLSQCDNCVVQNWTIANIYVNVAPNDENPVSNTITGIYFNSGNNSVVSGNTIHDAKWCIVFGYWPGQTTQNATISSNTIYNCDHGVAVYSDNSGAILNNLYVYGNTIHDAVNWDDTLDNNHHDGIHVSTVQSNTQLNGVFVYNNYIYGDWGFHCNAFIYLEGQPDPSTGMIITNANVFNNLLVNGSATNTCANGLIQDFGSRSALIANNTLIGQTNAAGTGIISEEANPFHTIINNNILSGFQNGMYIGQGNVLPASDYNDFYNVANVVFQWGTTCCAQLQSWSTQSGTPDRHSITKNPSLNGFVPKPGSAVHLAGTNLTSVGLSSLDADKAGNARPTGSCAAAGNAGCWDMGAFQSAPGPFPPTALNGQAH